MHARLSAAEPEPGWPATRCSPTLRVPPAMALLLQDTKLVNSLGEPAKLDPSVPVYLYFGAIW